MAQKSIQGNEILAKQIKRRRNELGLTIEEAASRAGVGTKTWSRYEAGESIRRDKCKGICKALNWQRFPNQDRTEESPLTVQDFRENGAWSSFLEDKLGTAAAVFFAMGSDMLLDRIKEDISELVFMPVGTHLGQLSISFLRDDLPKQFLMHYDYEFLYRMQCALLNMRERAKLGESMLAHSVMEELLFYLCQECASVLIDLDVRVDGLEKYDLSYVEEWAFDLFDDMKLIFFLYSNFFLDSDHMYHFDHWNDQVFYMDEE